MIRLDMSANDESSNDYDRRWHRHTSPQSLCRERNEHVMSPPVIQPLAKTKWENLHAISKEWMQKQNGNFPFHAKQKNSSTQQ